MAGTTTEPRGRLGGDWDDWDEGATRTSGSKGTTGSTVTRERLGRLGRGSKDDAMRLVIFDQFGDLGTGGQLAALQFRRTTSTSVLVNNVDLSPGGQRRPQSGRMTSTAGQADNFDLSTSEQRPPQSVRTTSTSVQAGNSKRLFDLILRPQSSWRTMGPGDLSSEQLTPPPRQPRMLEVRRASHRAPLPTSPISHGLSSPSPLPTSSNRPTGEQRAPPMISARRSFDARAAPSTAGLWSLVDESDDGVVCEGKSDNGWSGSLVDEPVDGVVNESVDDGLVDESDDGQRAPLLALSTRVLQLRFLRPLSPPLLSPPTSPPTPLSLPSTASFPSRARVLRRSVLPRMKTRPVRLELDAPRSSRTGRAGRALSLGVKRVLSPSGRASSSPPVGRALPLWSQASGSTSSQAGSFSLDSRASASASTEGGLSHLESGGLFPPRQRTKRASLASGRQATSKADQARLHRQRTKRTSRQQAGEIFESRRRPSSRAKLIEPVADEARLPRQRTM
ncbi:uncharacterized protein SCHCODRAFT_02557977 [Schizophyllum commune H4-8]|uniref:uncharacterized protein n=1 Tax=Schizophyllum commune (strain H4-8 / FGSC 9210) TaxID=578458 RepID=UPI002160A999|nr:uncharacterized protein SCHCODRAFT_02557977 [Schizophyllum commune H4-8]KAI5885024.1 hypothetical protein SCHCODRAFT_02557977 [Schizophyllum commune H4-8]